MGTFVELDDRIADPPTAITDRAERWATFHVGHHGRAVSEVAKDLGCDWHTVMDAASTCAWFTERPAAWCQTIKWATLELSGPYRAVYNTILPHAVQIADPFHVVKLANFVLDGIRRGVQNDTSGHRGRKTDPLYRIRKLMTIAHERLDADADAKLRNLLEAGDPNGEVRMA